MVSLIELPAQIETLLVWISAFMLAAGSAGEVIVQSLPENYKIFGTTICGGLIAGSVAILAIWHKFVNVLEANAPNTTATTTTTTTVKPSSAPAATTAETTSTQTATYPYTIVPPPAKNQ